MRTASIVRRPPVMSKGPGLAQGTASKQGLGRGLGEVLYYCKG